METARFEIKFVGEAVASGAIDVKYLAPTLLAVGDLIEESNRVLNEDRALVSVQLKADFQPGSFEGLLELGVSFLDQAKNLFTKGGLHDAKEILESIGFWGGSGVTLYRLIRKIGFRKQISETSLQGKQVSIELEDGEKVTASKPVADLYNDIKVLQAARKIAKAIKYEGISSIQFGEEPAAPNAIRTEITKEDLWIMEDKRWAAEGSETLHKSRSERVFGVVRPVFSGKYKWTLTDGSKRVHADIEDIQFLKQVENGEIDFTGKTLIKAKVEITTTRSKTGRLGSKYRVLKITGVICGGPG